MAFVKGRKKTGGRGAGMLNKAGRDIRSRISGLVDDLFDTIQDDLETLEPKDRIAACMKLLEYVLPKQREPVKEEEETFTEVSHLTDGSIVVRTLPFSQRSTPIQIIDPETNEIKDLNIGYDSTQQRT